MFAFVTLGSNDLNKSSKFYDKVLKPLGIVKAITNKRYIGYAKKDNLMLIDQGKSEFIEFYLIYPFNKKKATNGNGTMIALMAKSRDQVDKFHEVAIKLGVLNEGSPGQRRADSKNYYAYIRDISGNKICVHTKSL